MANRITSGIAYAFFNCNAELEQIEENMPEIRSDAFTPDELELRLLSTDDISSLGLDRKIMKIIKEKRDHRILKSGVHVDAPELIPLTDLRYLLFGEYPNRTNEDAANELADIMNVIYGYSSDKLVFNARILYEKNDEYVFRE